MPTKKIGTLFPIGDGGLALLIPAAWCRYYNLKAKDKLELIMDEERDTIKIRAHRSGGKTMKGVIMDIDFDDILETVIEKKEIEEALKEGPIPIPTSDMKPGEWTAVKVFALIVNPVYTGMGAYPRIVEDERWIEAIAKHIEKFGPHLTLRVMLDSLRQSLAMTE